MSGLLSYIPEQDDATIEAQYGHLGPAEAVATRGYSCCRILRLYGQITALHKVPADESAHALDLDMYCSNCLFCLLPRALLPPSCNPS